MKSKPKPGSSGGEFLQPADHSNFTRWTIAVGIAVAIGIFAVVGGKGSLPVIFAESGDSITSGEILERNRMFALIKAVELNGVKPGDVESAISSMGLGESDRRALIEYSRIQLPVSASTIAATNNEVAPVNTRQNSQNSSESSLISKSKSVNVPATRADALPRPAENNPVLAWITLWDTDAVDGDVVRVVSEGYTREITLVREPITFAIPVPKSGVINLIGLQDGGGGITVGIRSGVSNVSLPIMSEGQVLGIPVVAR